MNIRLHKNARTTPGIRREIQQTLGSDRALAECFGVTRDRFPATPRFTHRKRPVTTPSFPG